MSVMLCNSCGNFIDTDYCSEGWFMDVAPFGYKCQSCLEADNQGVDSSGNLIPYDEDGNEVRAA